MILDVHVTIMMFQGAEFTRLPPAGDVWSRADWPPRVSRVSRVTRPPQESQLPPGLSGAHPGRGEQL